MGRERRKPKKKAKECFGSGQCESTNFHKSHSQMSPTALNKHVFPTRMSSMSLYSCLYLCVLLLSLNLGLNCAFVPTMSSVSASLNRPICPLKGLGKNGVVGCGLHAKGAIGGDGINEDDEDYVTNIKAIGDSGIGNGIVTR